MKERKVCKLTTVNENIEDFLYRVKSQRLDFLMRHLLYYDEDSWRIGMRIWWKKVGGIEYKGRRKRL